MASLILKLKFFLQRSPVTSLVSSYFWHILHWHIRLFLGCSDKLDARTSTPISQRNAEGSSTQTPASTITPTTPATPTDPQGGTIQEHVALRIQEDENKTRGGSVPRPRSKRLSRSLSRGSWPGLDVIILFEFDSATDTPTTSQGSPSGDKSKIPKLNKTNPMRTQIP